MEELANRLVYFKRPDLLAEHTSEQMNDWLANCILTDDVSVPRVTLPKAFTEIKHKLPTANKFETHFLMEIQNFLKGQPQRLDVGWPITHKSATHVPAFVCFQEHIGEHTFGDKT